MYLRRSILVTAVVLLPQAAHARPFNPCDFDGDHKSDQVITRLNGTTRDWWVRLSGGGILQFTWGILGDVPLCADIDGDGRTDATVARLAASSTFWSRLSSGGMRVQAWGAPGDDPKVTGDYDGDGRDDFAIFRPNLAGSTYWILESSGALRVEAWGANTDFPQSLPDYDGDGKVDLGVHRGSIYLRRFSSGGSDAVVWGLTDDFQQSADYNGDGLTDIALMRLVSGNFFQWWVRNSATGAPIVPYGNGFFFGSFPGDVRAAADFDGDGRTDVAVWRAGVWWIQGTTAGLTTVSWGAIGDDPVHSRYWH